MLSAASQVGSASHRVLYTIGEEEVVEKERQDILLGLAKAVANATAALAGLATPATLAGLATLAMLAGLATAAWPHPSPWPVQFAHMPGRL